ncbi:MAG: leucyl aminopeptidase [Woeseiaceae bacterium]|jgi:leucyl aminopeptidase|nr:leucyl aminopeptidase [Woeseiaceae bacterium]|tara:strand:+ start:1380 stop:2879 length:1500 start_codon:yes stop_codon:yes gene_type:complete
MNYIPSKKSAVEISSDCLIIGVYNKNILSVAAEIINKNSNNLILNYLDDGDLISNIGEHRILTSVKNINAKRLLVVGLGDKEEFGIKEFKKANETAAKALLGYNLKNIANYLTLELKDSNIFYQGVRHSIESLHNNLYEFNELKSTSKKIIFSPENISLAIDENTDSKKINQSIEEADAISSGMLIAKNLGNLPANICTPSYLAKEAQKITKSFENLTTEVINETEMKKLEMHSLLSVTAGSKEPAKLIIMHYNGAGSKPPLVLVGKGVTFDTGGISIKPSAAMDEMKYDMCGAATAIGTMAVIAKLQLPINLKIVVPACENRPSSTATLPGDIVKSMSGKTIEILNTDAEGRLILCDALTYAERFKPKYIIDIATLTGACVIALGHHRTAIMSNDEKLSDLLSMAGEKSLDRAWKMPMGSEYEAQLKSNFADLANIGGRDGGMITAACFLGKFTKNMKWAHLDIAGTAWVSGAKKGSTGRPVPLLSEFIIQQSNADHQ